MDTEQEYGQIFINYLAERAALFSRNCFLNFPTGQNIVHLTLRVLASLQLTDKEQLSMTVIKCFESSLPVCEVSELKEEILAVGLYVLMKCPLPKEARNFMLILG
jgi:hypothetical protein